MNKSILHNYYNKIYCICLKERDDKYQYISSQFLKHKIDVEFYRPVIPGYSHKIIEPYINKYNNYNTRDILFNKEFPNELGAMQSHYHVIKSALLEGNENVFVFEDDCVFHKDFDNNLQKYFNILPENADGVLLYSYMANIEPQNIRVSARWTKGYASWSLIAYGLNKRTMKKYIDIQDSTPMIADKVTHIMMSDKSFNFYVATPPLVIPSKTLTSSIRGENKNYEKPAFLGGNIFMLGINSNDYE